MNKKVKLELGRFFGHEQHTDDFRHEMNRPKQVQEPFRTYDLLIKYGKYKGRKVTEAPTTWINYVLQNFHHLGKTHKVILQKELKNRFNK